MPEHTLIKLNNMTTFIRESSKDIRYNSKAEPKKPIEFTLLLTFSKPYPLLIKPSAKKPPNIKEKIATRLGISIE